MAARMGRIRTARLELIAAEPHVAIAEAAGASDWFRELSVPAPATWPPPLSDADSLKWFADRIAADPSAVGWFAWYVVHAQDARVLIGNCGFKGRPDPAGSVEIGYSLLPSHQRQGLGTELTGALIGWAFEHGAVARITAETLPELTTSIRVLEKHGFQLTGRGSAAGLIRFELRRAVFERRSGVSAPGSRASQSEGS
jgi:RimJ/RimL family protein N-acetyltransferase